jgi:hypothetical protein
MTSIPRSRLYYFVEQGMHLRVTVTLRAWRVEMWIYRVQWEFLDHAPENSMCVGLDCEYTEAVKIVKQKNLLPKNKQRHHPVTLVFQICHADAVPELLREFMNNDEMRSCSGTRKSMMSRC